MDETLYLLNSIGGSAGTNEGEDINVASRHASRHGSASATADHVNDTLGEDLLENFERGEVTQNTVSRQLHHNTVAHNQSGNQSSVGFVEGIVERTTAQNDTVRRTADLTDDTLLLFEGALFVLEVLQSLIIV